MESGTKFGHYEILSIRDNGHGSSVAVKGLNEDGSPKIVQSLPANIRIPGRMQITLKELEFATKNGDGSAS